MGMFRKDLDTMFSNKVAEYLAKGYHINTATMGGSQGEIAKVDLRKGDEILRIYLDNCRENFTDYVVLIVGRCVDRLHNNGYDSWDTIWNNRLEIIEEQKFYVLSRYGNSVGYYGTKADIEAINKKRLARLTMRSDANAAEKVELEKCKKVALSIMKKVPGNKTIKEDQIHKVEKMYNKSLGPIYYIYAKDHRYCVDRDGITKNY